MLDIIQDCLNAMDKKHAPITRDTRIDRYFIEVIGADSLEYLDLSFRLEKGLGVNLTDDDWSFLSGDKLCKSREEWDAKYAEMFTFGRLADFLAQRTNWASIKPITILGATSLAAGTFRSLQAEAIRIDRAVKDFGPSTCILDRFRGHKLAKFWARARTMSGNRVPPLHRTVIVRAFEFLYWVWGRLLAISLLVGVFGAILAGIIGVEHDAGFFGMSSGLFAVCCAIGLLGIASAGAVLYRVVKFLEPRELVLPHDIRTFEDLARLIAGERGGWCDACGYDLTGLTSDRCPECGTKVRHSNLPTMKTTHI